MSARLDDLDVDGRVVIVRSDLNVPLANQPDGSVAITDDGRVRASVPTIERLRQKGARVVVLAHLGRPKGQRVDALSLAPVGGRLAELLGAPVTFVDAVTGTDVADAVSHTERGDVILLQNVRFDPRETSKNVDDRRELAAEWAQWADAFVSDGFGVVHREQASVTDVARLLPRAPGLLVEQEMASFARVLSDPERPFVVVMGGSKVSDKLAVIGHLLDRVDRLLVGGGMAFTFLRAEGFQVGESLLEEDQVATVQQVMDEARRKGVEIVLPVDVVIAREISPDAEFRVVSVGEIPSGWKGLDIGPATATLFAERLDDARTVVWNGPMGVFEVTPFADGTRAVAESLAASPAFTVVGGGDSAAAIRILGIDESRFDHISTGGGASLELLEGRTLPGLAVLEETP
ncbi:MAG: phosphoglycerate kinase [Actinomycetales bacterium mxb001]|nr:MAG: phosphoglycerate kinase [Actinomycetales bacterium mxb001]